MLYATISVGNRYGLSQDEKMKLNFERMCVYFHINGDVTRGWGQFTTLAWPDTLAMNLLSYLQVKGKAIKIRHLVVRWSNLDNIMTLCRMNNQIARRFPTYDHLVEAGVVTDSELVKLEKIAETTDSLYPIYWVPLQWAQVEIRKAKDAGHISSDLVFTKLQESLQDLEVKNKSLLGYGWMNIPLVYTQLDTLLGRHYLAPTRHIGANGDYINNQGATRNP